MSGEIPRPELVINGEKVERVLECKCLGTIIEHKITFDSNTKLIQRTCQCRIYFGRGPSYVICFLQRLRSFGVNQLVLGISIGVLCNPYSPLAF